MCCLTAVCVFSQIVSDISLCKSVLRTSVCKRIFLGQEGLFSEALSWIFCLRLQFFSSYLWRTSRALESDVAPHIQ